MNDDRVHIREIGRGDRDALLRFYADLTPESLHDRFFDVCTPERAMSATPTANSSREYGVVAEANGTMVGVAHYFVAAPNARRAEVAVTVADAFQGHGVGTRLIDALVTHALASGVEQFEADVLAANSRMLALFLHHGFEITANASGVVHVRRELSTVYASGSTIFLRSA